MAAVQTVHTFWVATIFLTPLLLSLALAYDHTVYVDCSNPNATDDVTCGSHTHPCCTFSYAVSERVLNFTQVVVSSGDYSLNHMISLSGLTNIALTGVDPFVNGSSQPVVTVTCESGAGLSFVQSSDITIQNVHFSGCGALQNSTSRNFSDNSFSFMQFPVGVYFLFCQHINLTGVSVTNSTGTGMAVYATGGLNYIQNCSFLYNRPPNNEIVPSGGGLYIEFPFCDPQLPSDCDAGTTSIPPQYSTGVEYRISECVFGGNRGHMWHPVEYIYLLPQDTNHLTFGHGGGLSVFFSEVENSSVAVERCVFENNEAEWGGGVFVEFQQFSWNNMFIMDSCRVYNNTAYLYNASATTGQTTGGGGMKLGFHFSNDSRMSLNTMLFQNCTFQHNWAYWGGGVYFDTARERSRSLATNRLLFYDCSWLYNLGRVGSAMDLSEWSVGWTGAITNPVFTDCIFIGNNDYPSVVSTLGQPIGVGTVNTHTVPLNFNNSVHFENNNRSALAVVDSGVHFLENCIANFTGNQGRTGGAIALYSSSYIRIYDHTQMIFIDNIAGQYGGAIYSYAVGQHMLFFFGTCFIQYSDPTLQPWNWTASFYFKGNTALYSDGGNAIYGTSLVPCFWGYYTPMSKKKVPDPRRDVFCWNSAWEYDGGNCSDDISSAPAAFSNTGNDSSYHMEVILGKRQLMPVEVLGDRMKNQTAHAVFNLWSHSPDTAQIPSAYTYVSDNTVELTGEPNSTALLAIETINPRVLYTEIVVEILPCPPGFSPQNDTHNNTQCVCTGNYGGVVRCNQADFSVRLRRGQWMGIDESSDQLVVGMCPYTAVHMEEEYVKLPNKSSGLDELLCHPVNRQGMFCGQCVKGYAPAINSNTFDCVKCTHKQALYHWVYYLLLEILPITIFFFIVVLFHISVTRGSANGFIFFAQLLTTTFDIDGDKTVPIRNVTSSAITLQKIYEVPYDIWNLNFFTSVVPPFCISPDVDTLGVLSLHYVLAVYPLLLILVFYCTVSLYERGIQPIFCLCKPVHRIFGSFQRRWNLNRSTIDAFSTFLVLSYTKFTVVSTYLLTPTTVQDSTGPRTGHHLYYQGGTEYLGKEHIPYFIMAMFVMITFVLLPPLILFVYPLKLVESLTRRLGCCGQFFQAGGRMQVFLDTFQGCFKDGTNGTRDCRYFAGLYFLLRTIIFTSFIYTGIWFQQYVVQQLVCTIGILLFAVIRPYKKDFYNNVDATILGILALINVLSMYNIFYAAMDIPLTSWAFALQYLLIFCPLFYMICYVIYRIVKNNDQSFRSCLSRCMGTNVPERSPLVPLPKDTDDETSEAPPLSSADEEYRLFVEGVEAFGRDRERNRYRPKHTNSTTSTNSSEAAQSSSQSYAYSSTQQSVTKTSTRGSSDQPPLVQRTPPTPNQSYGQSTSRTYGTISSDS